MISIARSRYTLAVQFLFLIINGIGVFLVTIYNASTPDFYPNNAHHKLGWILTWTVSAQVLLGLISAYAGKDDRGSFMRVSAAAMEEHTRRHELRRQESYRFSNDSGQGTEPNTESLRSQSISSTHSDLPDAREPLEEEDEEKGLMHGSKVDKFLKSKIPGMLSTRVLKVLRFLYNAVDRTILILGFVGFTTGIITYGGFFVSVLLSLRRISLTKIDGTKSLQWIGTLDQRRCVLLVRYPDSRPLGRLFRRYWMGMEHQAIAISGRIR